MGERFTLPSSCEKDGIVPSLLTDITWQRSDAVVGEGRCWRGLAEDTGAGFCFFFRNSTLRLAFLLMVDRLGFFLEGALAWVSRATTPCVKGEGEAGANHKGELESRALAAQCLAEVQALDCQVGFTHCSHF